MNDLVQKYDHWLENSGPAALVIREQLMPVEGRDGVLFPATFADTGYNIDKFDDGGNVCLIDSVGSQANRIEPIFMTKDYAGLVPQIVVQAGNKKVNLLEAGHRAGDAIIRCSELQQTLRAAFNNVLNGNAEPLARIAPTSLVFGVWDSRDTQAKLPRLVASTIRAYNVRPLTRSAQYVPAVDYNAEGLLEEPGDLRDAEGKVKSKHPFAQRGFVHVPATGALGGVIATGGIRRDATLHLAALRLLSAGQDEAKSKALRRYILSLALTAFTVPVTGYLRQGCNLVLDPENPLEFKEVFNDGTRNDVGITHTEAIVYAKAVAKEFGIDPERNLDEKKAPDREVPFDKVLAKKDVSDAGGSKKKAK
ncbi:type I-U CRISPR-associated protein Cas7 [Geobacter sulfurreducens]|uniref:CRISPR-associated protein Csb1 n=1 Tax=Geobacter sulfurreducens (strain ATCC 51573 / DSM 12127 / PCA) TaxID=243231 RepID=Q74H40_GEOSL|nr:type I-U CRISPR-associated RAMP protein Csb1/Cas7u [Geobacter sulfurreducens]AAR33388.1 CRISPR-associated protein Csb1 [Geobacter sulfurreducens PCA]UAC04161.1 type I-U CRISPR-associated protein Cas7 [Geobacter sulfurreducens]HCD97095.1 type I-U CRISPR-associated protein Cas7 [Geobacter sulfurreducens]